MNRFFARSLRSLSLESRLVLLIGILFGGLAVVFVPPLITFDAPGHFYRSLQVTRGEFRAPELGPNAIGGNFPVKYTKFSDGQWWTYWQPQHDFGTLARWAAASQSCAPLTGERSMDITNTAIESPVNHLVQGLGLRCAELLSGGPLWATRIGCIFNLLCYLAVIVAAIELLPGFRRGLLLFALSPLILIQAASLSHDAINFSLPVLFIAAAWWLRVQSKPVTRGVLVAVVALGCLVALLKPIAGGTLVCFLFVPTSAFGSLRRRVLSILALIACAGTLWLAWNLAYRDLDIALAMEPSRPPDATLLHKQWVWQHPFAFGPVFGRFLIGDLWEQWPVFFGEVGGWIGPGTQRILTLLSLVFLFGLIGAENTGGKRDWTWSASLFAQSFLLLFGTCFVCWFALGTVGMPTVPGLGGRYLLLVYLGFFAALLPFLPRLSERLRTVCLVAALAANVAGLLSILVPTAILVWG